MFKTLTCAALVGLATTAASAATVDAFDLNVESSLGTDSTAVLELGQKYTLTVSGTFNVGSDPSRHVSDAEYFNLGSNPLAPQDGTAIEIGVGVDGTDIDFGAYSPTNTYTAVIDGTGSTINVFFADSFYGDNVGTLSVVIAEISPVPLPAGAVLLLTGLAGLGLARRKS